MTGTTKGGPSSSSALESAALARRRLHRAGLEGAGLTLTETGSLALEALDVMQEAFDLSNSAAVTAFIHDQTGEVFHTTSAPEGEAAKRLGTRVVHRSDLYSLLLETAVAAGISIATSSKLIAIDHDADRVHARFANGKTASGARTAKV